MAKPPFHTRAAPRRWNFWTVCHWFYAAGAAAVAGRGGGGDVCGIMMTSRQSTLTAASLPIERMRHCLLPPDTSRLDYHLQLSIDRPR